MIDTLSSNTKYTTNFHYFSDLIFSLQSVSLIVFYKDLLFISVFLILKAFQIIVFSNFYYFLYKFYCHEKRIIFLIVDA